MRRRANDKNRNSFWNKIPEKKTPLSGVDYIANFIVPEVHFA